MQKIGVTFSGILLVEMSPEEFERIQALTISVEPAVHQQIS